MPCGITQVNRPYKYLSCIFLDLLWVAQLLKSQIFQWIKMDSLLLFIFCGKTKSVNPERVFGTLERPSHLRLRLELQHFSRVQGRTTLRSSYTTTISLNDSDLTPILSQLNEKTRERLSEHYLSFKKS